MSRATLVRVSGCETRQGLSREPPAVRCEDDSDDSPERDGHQDEQVRKAAPVTGGTRTIVLAMRLPCMSAATSRLSIRS